MPRRRVGPPPATPARPETIEGLAFLDPRPPRQPPDHRPRRRVDNTAFEVGPQDWCDVGAAADAAEAGPHLVDAGRVPVVLVRNGTRLLALADRCTHRGGPLHEGSVEGGCITCPWHARAFRLEDGEVERGPAALPPPVYGDGERGGRLEVRRLPRS